MKVRTIGISSLLALLVMASAAGAAIAAPASAAAAGTQSLPALSRNAAGFIDLSVEQLAKSMKSKNFTLINVHVPLQGNLPNTDLNIAFDQVKNNLDKLPAKDKPIVLYCRSGGMSTQVAAALAGAGYSKIYELDGGSNAWQAAGHALLKK